jgi:hypothetical protein
VGHLARLIEQSGIPTVILATDVFEARLLAMTPARTLLTPYVMGQPVGPPGEKDLQKRAVVAALELLPSARDAGTSAHLR